MDKQKISTGTPLDEWNPIHFKATSETDSLRWRHGVNCLLPSGVQQTSSVTAKVDLNGKVLQHKVAIPEAFL